MARNGHARLMSRQNTSVIIYIILSALVVVLFYFYWSLNTEVKTFRAEKKTLQAELSYNEGEVSKYTQQIKSLTEELQRVTQSKRDVDSEKEKMSAELSETKASLDSANIKTNEYKASKDRLQQQLDTKADEIDRLTQEAINKQSSIDTCQKEKDEYNKKMQSSTTAFQQKISSLEDQVRNLQQEKAQLRSEVSDKSDLQSQLQICLRSKQTSHINHQPTRNQNDRFSHNTGQWEHHIPNDGHPNIHNKPWSQNNQFRNSPPIPHNNPGTEHNLINNKFGHHNVPQIKQPSTTNDEEGEQPVLGVGADEEKDGKPQNPDLVLGFNHHDNHGGNQNNRQDNENQETDNNKDKQTSKVGGAGGDDGGAGKDYQTDDHQGEPKKEVNLQDEEGRNNDNAVNKGEDNPQQHKDMEKQPIEDSNALHKEDFDHIANLLEQQRKVDYAKDDESQEHDRLKRQEPFDGAFGGDHGPNGRHTIDDLDLSKFLNKPFDKMPPGFQNGDPNKPGFAHGPFDRRQFPGFQQNPGYEQKPYDSRFKNPPPGFFGDGRSEDEKQLELPMENHGHQSEDKKPYDRQL